MGVDAVNYKNPCSTPATAGVTRFFDFNVYSLDNNHSFVHIDCSDSEAFYSSFAEFFFSEERLLKYAENDKCLRFKPQPRHYATLYKSLLLFVDKPKEYKLAPSLDQEIVDLLAGECEVLGEDEFLKVRDSTIGRFGEYFLHTLLSEYFGLDCVIPKVWLTTNRDMSVFGIDSLFYSSEKKILYFGEAKVSKSLSSGIDLLKESLATYEHQISEEFLLVLSKRRLVGDSSFYQEFADEVEAATNVVDFIRAANVQTIGVPLFIAHGDCYSAEKILRQLNKLKLTNLLGLSTIYIGLSLPIVDKEKMVGAVTQHVRKKLKEYESMART